MREAHVKRIGLFAAGVTATVLLALPSAGAAAEGSRFQPSVRSHDGVVVSGSPYATSVGVAALRKGGNAVDAAVATVFALSVTRPDVCGIGGRVAMLVRRAAGSYTFVDGGTRAPLSATPTSIGSTPGGIDLQGRGHRIVGVPGTVAGLETAQRRLGHADWPDLVQPAERLARGGFVVGPTLAQTLASSVTRLGAFGPASEIFLVSDRPYAAGETLVQLDLAQTLARIEAHGSDGFYRGRTAELIANEMAKPPAYPGDEGMITLQDLSRYRAPERKPLETTYRGYRVTSAPSPEAGQLVVETLNILRGFDLGSLGPSTADALHIFSEATKIADADSVYVADPDFVALPTAVLTSPGYAARRRGEISLAEARTYEPGLDPPVNIARASGGHTTHASVIDREGNAVAVTCTLGSAFGSGVVAAGTGVVFNNSLRGFGPAGDITELKPGAMPPSAIVPTIVERLGVPTLVLGAAGDAAIDRAVPEVISNVVDFGMDIAHAVDAERLHAYQDELGPYFEVEGARFAPGVLDELERRGHQFDFDWGEYSRVLAVLNAAGVEPRSRDRLGSADPRDVEATARGE